MRFIKLGLISIVFFFLLLTGISLLLPSSINISKAIDINAPADSVFSYINDMAKWKSWYAGYADSAATMSAPTSGKGASLRLNNTEISLTEVLPRKIKALWQTAQNTPLPGEFNIASYDSSSMITLQWLFVQKVRWYPWEKFSLIVSNQTIGPFMEQSLDNLKKVLEKQ